MPVSTILSSRSAAFALGATIIFARPCAGQAGQSLATTSAPSTDIFRDSIARGLSVTITTFALTHDGPVRLDPYGPDGRREMLHVVQVDGTSGALFERMRLERIGVSDTLIRETGAFGVENGAVTLRVVDTAGTLCRIERGRYAGEALILFDAQTGRELRYQPSGRRRSILF